MESSSKLNSFEESFNHTLRNSPSCPAPTHWYSAEWDNHGPKTGWYFFYGTLMDPSTLCTIIGSKNMPVYRRAKVVGYKTMLFGPYPVLLDGLKDAVVHGVAFKVESAAQAEMLQDYEGEEYKPETCRIHCEDDGTVIDGVTFMWDGNMADLVEGHFDLKEWLKNNPGGSLE